VVKLGAIPYIREHLVGLDSLKKVVSQLRHVYTPPCVILLVEDEVPARRAFAQILRNRGYVVMEAGDGLEALSLLDKDNFDLVISDILMPHLNGYALLARIRVKWPKMPIILTSGYLSQDAAKSVLSGSAEFLPKPIDPPTLIETVQRLLGKAQQAE
jgi:CheY-like chemotaxis protein